jgi:eukaryotic-like serine/threonine-protein kinase
MNMLSRKTEDAIPECIGHYKVTGRLGKGGMGDIYKAIQEPLNRIVALKVLPPKFGRDEEFARRFEIEAKAISLLQHQNIVSIYEYGEEDGYRFFAMQFVDGTDLSRYIGDHREVGITEIIDFSKQICRGLRYAHANNVIHRDIKPQNILIDKGGVVKLSDFGIAKIFSGTEITMTGFTLGTPEYMSPEQALGKKIDQQTDIYSLGIVMYEMLTRHPPFGGRDPMGVAYKQVHEQPLPPSQKRKDTPKRLELIVLKALKKDKEERYQSVEEMLDHLDSVDPNERVDKETESIETAAPPETRTAMPSTTERRIVDRRNGSSTLASMSPVSRRYWMELAKTQWASWLLIGGIGVAFLLHMFRYHW